MYTVQSYACICVSAFVYVSVCGISWIGNRTIETLGGTSVASIFHSHSFVGATDKSLIRS